VIQSNEAIVASDWTLCKSRSFSVAFKNLMRILPALDSRRVERVVNGVGFGARADKLGAVIRNVIFDWSGTLVDDLPAVVQATNAVLRDAGLPGLSVDEFRLRFRLPFADFYREFGGKLPMDELEACFHRHFRAVQSTVNELPHARDFLLFCRRHGLRTFVLSTVMEEYYAAQAALHGFAVHIDHPYLGVRDKRTRIREILTTHELQPAETLFIGDMQHDIETARHGGVLSCAVLTGYNRLEQLRASHPDLIVEHLGELQAILERNGFQLSSPGGEGGIQGEGLVPVPTVGALIFDDAGRVLMVRTRKWSNLWGIPGGKIKSGETALGALHRELKEETNLEIGDARFVMVQDCIRSPEFYRDAHFLLLNYVVRRVGDGAVRLNDEAEEFRWLALEEALNLALNRPTRVLIEAVMARPAGEMNCAAETPVSVSSGNETRDELATRTGVGR
jgi:phosphoglycolate phosphatase